MEFFISPLGTRGWMPIENRHTTSFFIKYKNTNILLDCGTGITRFLQPEIKSLLNGNPLHIIFYHYHLDHIIGLTYLSGIFEKNYKIVHSLLTQVQADVLKNFLETNFGIVPITVELKNENPGSPSTKDFYIINFNQGLQKGGLFYNFTVELIEV